MLVSVAESPLSLGVLSFSGALATVVLFLACRFTILVDTITDVGVFVLRLSIQIRNLGGLSSFIALIISVRTVLVRIILA